MSIKAVCFDLGGVLVRICSNWPQALAACDINGAGIDFASFDDRPEFTLFQAGQLSESDYLTFLSTHLEGLGLSEALRVHNAILIEPYPDTLPLVQELETRGIITGCLSNTNSIHWREMVEGHCFPAVAGLQVKIASHIAKCSKPNPLIYQAFEQATLLDPHEILNFDDVQTYVDSAKSAGWSATKIDPTQDTAPQMRESLETFGLL